MGLHTKALNFSDAAIKRHLTDSQVKQLRDLRFPLRLRFNKARTGGSWYVVRYAESTGHWRKIGNWPALSARVVVERMSDILGDLAVDPDAKPAADGVFVTVGDLMRWHLARVEADRNLSDSRRGSILSSTNKHIIPRIGSVALIDVCHQVVDEQLMWPLQADYSVSYCRMIFEVMRGAFRNARKLRQITVDPCSGMRFSDFITAPAEVKQGALRADMIPMLAEKFRSVNHSERMLAMLMLCHGTRIGETRKSKWQHFAGLDGGEASWNIPKTDTKTRAAHRLPLTDHVKRELVAYRAAQRKTGYTGAYLFPGDSGQPMSAVTANRVIQFVSGRKWTAHDLRKLARTCWADLGVDYMVGELLLNHALSKLDRTYIHTYVERQIVEALESYHDYLAGYKVFSLPAP